MHQRDPSKPSTAQGLYERYRVARIDGKDDDGEPEYFVLRVDNLDIFKPEAAALRAYIDTAKVTHPQLAADLEKFYMRRAGAPALEGKVADTLSSAAATIRATMQAQPPEIFRAERLSEGLVTALQVGLAAMEAAAPIVRVHETGSRIASIFDPLTAAWTPQMVHGCALAPRERLPEGFIAIEQKALAALHDEIARLQTRLGALAEPQNPTAGASTVILADANDQPSPIAAERVEAENVRLRQQRFFADLVAREADDEEAQRLLHAQATAEALWHTLREIAERDDDKTINDLEFRAVARALANRRSYLIYEHHLGADGKLGSGAWLGIGDQPGQPLRWRSKIEALMAKVQADAPELVDSRFVDVSWMADPNRTVFRFEGLPDVAIPDASAHELIREYLSKCMPSSLRPTTLVADAALAVRLEACSQNLAAIEDYTGERLLPKLIHDAMTHAIAVTHEAAEELLRRGRRYWLVDENNDNEGETFGLAFPDTPEVAAALGKWARSLDAIVCAETEREPYADPLDVELGTGTSLKFHRPMPATELIAIEQVSSNDYSSRVRFMTPEGVRAMVNSVNALTAGESLTLYKGNLSTCYSDEDERSPRDVVDMWQFEDDSMLGDAGEQDQVPEADALPTPEELVLRVAQNEAATEAFIAATMVPDEPGTLAAHYHQQGWELLSDTFRKRTHLARPGAELLACGEVAALLGGAERVEPLNDQLDFPPHHELCARCCAAANDQTVKRE